MRLQWCEGRSRSYSHLRVFTPLPFPAFVRICKCAGEYPDARPLYKNVKGLTKVTPEPGRDADWKGYMRLS